MIISQVVGEPAFILSPVWYRASCASAVVPDGNSVCVCSAGGYPLPAERSLQCHLPRYEQPVDLDAMLATLRGSALPLGPSGGTGRDVMGAGLSHGFGGEPP